MKMSEQINELATALSKAQGEIKNAVKETKNEFFKSKYADLAAVLEEARKALSKHGLSIVQTTDRREDAIYLITTMLHISGQWVDSELPLILQKQDMQGLGSALTYARRYSLAAICGIAQEDDDGNLASKKPDPHYEDFPPEKTQRAIPTEELPFTRKVQPKESSNQTLADVVGVSKTKGLSELQLKCTHDKWLQSKFSKSDADSHYCPACRLTGTKERPDNLPF
jgi:hypothetical protein